MRPGPTPAGSAESALRRVENLRHLVGNTPLLAIHYRLDGHAGVVYAKAEHLNLTGSIKDRMALYIVSEGRRRGVLKPGDRIVEATSGNTGLALAAIGAALGHPVTIFMPDWMSRERTGLMRAYGAEVRPVSREEGGFLGAIERAEALARQGHGVFLARQFSNHDNVRAHETTTGPEMVGQVRALGREPDAFVAGVGTGGTVMGVGRFLRSQRPGTRVHPVEPASSPTLSTGCRVGSHRIQGISDEFIPPIVDLDFLDEVLSVHDGDAILMAQQLSRRLGLGVGISSGANLLAAIRVREELGPDATVLTVLPDDNKKYLTTDLFKEEPVRGDYLAPRISLRGVESHRRVCETCIAPGEPLPAFLATRE